MLIQVPPWVGQVLQFHCSAIVSRLQLPSLKVRNEQGPRAFSIALVHNICILSYLIWQHVGVYPTHDYWYALHPITPSNLVGSGSRDGH